jgi:hypothetical protein
MEVSFAGKTICKWAMASIAMLKIKANPGLLPSFQGFHIAHICGAQVFTRVVVVVGVGEDQL